MELELGSTAQSGGRLLGTGVYGCTFEPAPRCVGGPVFKTVMGRPAAGKITLEDPREEVGIGKRIMALPMALQYFALPVGVCNTALPIPDADASGCEFLKKIQGRPTIPMMLMPAGGMALDAWARKLPRLAASLERILVHLLEGMVIYQQAGYVHNDLHLGNILVDDAGVARIIDFGEAFRPDSVRRWEDTRMGLTFRPKYVNTPPEVHAWRALKEGIPLRRAVSMLKEANPEYARIEFLFKRSAEASLMSVMGAWPRLTEEEGADAAFVRLYGTRFDSWRIGLCMFWLLFDLMQWSGFRETTFYKEREYTFSRAIGGLLEFDPRRRLSAAQALAILDPKNRLAIKTLG